METIFKDFVAGVVYSDFIVGVDKLKHGQRLKLVAEPENIADEDAILVKHGKKKLGYIPRTETARFHLLHKQQAKFRTTVVQFVPSNSAHRMIYIQVQVRTQKNVKTCNDFKSF